MFKISVKIYSYRNIFPYGVFYMDEKIMRTKLFGGFDKKDVLSYVDDLKKQVEDLKSDLQKKDENIDALNSQVASLSKECEKIAELNGELLEKDKRIVDITAQNIELAASVDALSAVSREYEGAKAKLEKSQQQIKDEQARLGAAFLDARRYSSEIVAAANEKAHNASLGFSEDITKQAGEISRLSEEIDRLSASFTKSVDELQANIAVLASRMSAAAKNLSIRQDATFEPDLNLSFDVDDDATGVEQTNDGSGLTYIQYPPHTEFNEDLNIQPDGSFGASKKTDEEIS